MKWYQISVSQALSKNTAKATGLQSDDRKNRLQAFGSNTISEKEELKTWQKIAKHFTDLLMLVLMAAAILKFFIGDYVEGSIIFLVVVINGLVGYWQERKAEESLDGLKKMMGQVAVVLVEGVKQTVNAESLVPGDIVALKAGDIVPADIRLIEVHDFIVEEAILTGESEPVAKTIEAIAGAVSIGDQKNMAFSGTLVQEGYARGVVTATGDGTEIGKISQSIQSVHKQTTPLIRKMQQLNAQIFKGIMFLIVFLVFFTTLRFGMDMRLLFSTVIALIVAMVPEGLPAVLTMILSMGVKEMSEEQAIIKTMPSVETLGSMTVICSDKTGTLTKNEMTVADVRTDGKDNTLTIIKEIMNNCQELKLDEKQRVEELKGNPTELALLHYVAKARLPLKKIIAKIPFSSSYKYMATMHEAETGNVIYVKGAPEVLLGLATLTKEEKAYWQEKSSSLAQKGQRVLGFAYKNASPDTELTHETLRELYFAGMAGIIDPPKESAVQAVKECREVGISVKMITGDHKETAQAIGQQVGLQHTGKVLEGLDIDRMTDEMLAEQVKQVDVFARTTPEHKLRIITALQTNGEIVGMTGDGVNDAPALKKADIGIAMGIKGSEVSKQAADMVLSDDNFHTIAKAVKEGRRIFDNLKKTIKFFLPSSLAQGLIVVLAMLLNQPLPLTPVQILWVNMVTTITLSYALGFEKAHPDTMKRPPRPVGEGILSGYSIFRIIYVSLLIMLPAYLMALQFEGQALQQTILLQSVVLAQAGYMISCREILDFSLNKSILQNKALFISLGLLAVLQSTIQLMPFAQDLLGTASLTLGQNLLVLGFAIVLFVTVELEKLVTKTLLARSRRKSESYQQR